MQRRFFSVAPSRRVLCSLQQLKALRGRALKFPLFTATAATAADPPSASAPTARATRGGRSGFVFFCETSRAPRAFVNSCPHALLELDLNDSDFFCDGFIQCKAHGAFFDPQTGICLQGPASARRGRLDTQLGALTELAVRVDGTEVVLDADVAVRTDREKSEQYRASLQQQLAAVLAARSDDVERIQRELDEKTMARMRQYAVKSATNKPAPGSR